MWSAGECISSPSESSEDPDPSDEDSGESNVELNIPDWCPPLEDPKYPTLLPHQTDCNKFYRCLYGFPEIVNCPEGQEWSLEHNYCTYDYLANCVRPLPEDWEPAPTPPHIELSTVDPIDLPDGCPLEEDGQIPTHLAHPTDCTKFYKCQGGIPIEMDCPEGEHWSIDSDYCDYPPLANCVRPLK